MAYGQLRLLDNNLITSHSMITPSSVANGRISSISNQAQGVATMTITGPFQGSFDLLYTIEIDSVTGGTEVEESTFRWKTSDTPSGWEETGVTASATPYALNADGLGTNLSISFTGATGTDFLNGDIRQFSAKALYGTERLLDFQRKTVWRATGDTSENLVIDFGSAQTPLSLVISDHNLTSGANVKLQAHTSDSWGAPSYDSGLITIQDPLYFYLPAGQNYRYWRVLILDPSNPDGYVELSGLFLGTYPTFDAVNASWGSSRRDGYVLQANQSESGIQRKYAYARRRSLSLIFGNTTSNDDIDKFLAIQDNLIDTDTYSVSPLWVHLFYDEADTLNLMEWDNIEEWSHTYFRYLFNSDIALELTEVPFV